MCAVIQKTPLQPAILEQDKSVFEHHASLQNLSNGRPLAYAETLRCVKCEGSRTPPQAQPVTRKPPVRFPHAHSWSIRRSHSSQKFMSVIMGCRAIFATSLVDTSPRRRSCGVMCHEDQVGEQVPPQEPHRSTARPCHTAQHRSHSVSTHMVVQCVPQQQQGSNQVARSGWSLLIRYYTMERYVLVVIRHWGTALALKRSGEVFVATRPTILDELRASTV